MSGGVFHHSKPIPNAIVYIKYGATDFPGTDITTYDNHTTADANAHYQFDDLRMGNYYLYGVGWDNSISSTVTGGVAVKLKYNKSYSTAFEGILGHSNCMKIFDKSMTNL